MIDDGFIAALRDGKMAAVARAVSIVENELDGFEELLTTLQSQVGRGRRIGITGPPGAGKSTLVEGLAGVLRAQGLRVAVIAVDPTSPFTGGALLGDRIRMETLALDPGVYIRSMATRGSLGGLTTATGEVCDVVDAAGYDRILVETVGVGQSELDVATMTDITLLVMVPESGDGIQALKSGIIEAADVIVVNKADRPGAELLQRDIELSLDLRAGTPHRRAAPDVAAWRPPVLLTIATERSGMTDVADAIDRRWEQVSRTGELVRRRGARAEARTRAVVERSVARSIWSVGRAPAILSDRHAALTEGTVSPYQVAQEILTALLRPLDAVPASLAQ